jgi:6-phosphogluconolactonase
VAAALYVPKMNQWRVTLLPAPLQAARNMIVYSTGADKRDVIADIVSSAYDPLRLPAQLILRGAKRVIWFLDQPAAVLLQNIPVQTTPE